MDEANASLGSDTIAFNITGAGTHTIQPGSALPTITDPVTIDGTTQPGFAGTPVIELDGSLAGSSDGLVITAGNSTLRGLVINRFASNGRTAIRILGSAGNAVETSFVGTDVSGTLARPNRFGIIISSGSQSNRIGTNGDGVSDAQEGNVISGNIFDAMHINDPGTNFNVVAGNFIGTDRTGTFAVPNGGDAVSMYNGAQFNHVGTNGDGVGDEAERNVLSGNLGRGVWICHPGTQFNIVAGNFIGTDKTGTIAVPNNLEGVILLVQATFNIIGTNGDGVGDASERNVISGNGNSGIRIQNAGTDSNVFAGFVGTDVTGTRRLGNRLDGISINPGGPQFNVIGTNGDGHSDESERNVISGNGRDGVQIVGSGSNRNVVAGNYLGTDVTGTTALGNSRFGVFIVNGPRENIIGTTGDGQGDSLERNLISGNGNTGVNLFGAGTNGNAVAGNLIGVDVNGTAPLGNAGDGVSIINGAQRNRLGTNGDGMGDAAERNVISGNRGNALTIANLGTNENVVAGNLVGTDVTGTIAIGNGAADSASILIFGGAQFNRIGTNGDGLADTAERNVISGNHGAGMSIQGPGTSDNIVAGNFIGTDITGTRALPNPLYGIGIGIGFSGGGSQRNRVGTNGDGVADEAERNVISGNGQVGVMIGAAGTDFNVVAGNYIGTDVTGSAALGNGSAGVFIVNGARSNRIGTDGNGIGDVSERNVLSGNGWTGVSIESGGSDNIIAGNFIGTNATGTAPLGNRFEGVVIWYGSAHNRVGTNGDGVADEAERNIISGNGFIGSFSGIVIALPGTDGNIVAGNYIGSDATGTAPLGNAGHGISVWGGAKSNRIGSDGNGLADQTERNLISANAVFGVAITDPATEQNVVAGNYVGTDVSGTSTLGSQQLGVFIAGGAAHNRVGTDGNGTGDAAERNVISGATVWGGLWIRDPGSDDNVVAGNYIGTNAAGISALGNASSGVVLFLGPKANRIGTNSDGVSDAAERNVVSGNNGRGLSVYGVGTDGNLVSGNFIGTDWTGTTPLANDGDGVLIGGGASANRVGIDATANPAAANVIAWNRGAGVNFADPFTCFEGPQACPIGMAIGNQIRGNSIHSNSGLGIDLGGDGVTPNDPSDADTGSNGLQNFPVISLARSGSPTRVVGSLHSTPGRTFVLDFYANTTASDLEGERYLGSSGACGPASVTTNASGDASFDVLLSAATSSGETITVTATDCTEGNTSEFSAAITANVAPVPIFTVAPAAGVPGQTLTYAGSFTDSDHDTWSLSVDCGPAGTVDSPSINQTLKTYSFTCTYSTAGPRTVSVTVTDDKGGSGTAEANVVIGFANVQTGVCCSGSGAALIVGSLTVNDRIHVSPISNDGTLQVKITNRTNDVVEYQQQFAPPSGGFAQIVIFGQGADDYIQIADSISVPACVHAGAGNDNVKGGGGNDILLGGEGDDLLVGGNGRDLLIGGYGSDRLVGNADDDILIAGTTDFDSNEQALCDIMNEWTRSDADYGQRVSHLRGESGGGMNGSANLIFDGPAATVHDDHAADVLTGSAGQDWFLLNIDGDGGVMDKVTDLHASEFANDIDFIGGA